MPKEQVKQSLGGFIRIAIRVLERVQWVPESLLHGREPGARSLTSSWVEIVSVKKPRQKSMIREDGSPGGWHAVAVYDDR
jgi:hypothetical protein